LLATSSRGKTLLGHFESGAAVRPEQDLAIRYAGWLTADVHGVDDERFRQVRGYYTDPQIVELTLTVSFFNYFTRLVQAANLPVEAWSLEPPVLSTQTARPKQLARIGLIPDTQLAWARSLESGRRQGGNTGGLGSGDEYGLVNSQRAMFLVPDIANAWRNYTSAAGRDAQVTREIKLQVSFAVSMANGCRYCTLHQVQGLRSLGVSPGKLLDMQKDDAALTPRELTAVVFARTLTRTAASISDRDYAPLRAEFGDRGALEVVLQTCMFAFMNRFTDNLGLPSEDEAVRIYREVYGKDFKQD
jgi:AhpD family alkylhydroperoxidase